MKPNRRIISGLALTAIVASLIGGYIVWWERHTNTPPTFAYNDNTDEAAWPILDLYFNELGTTVSALETALNGARYDTAVRCLHDAGVEVNRDQLARIVEAPLARLQLQRADGQLVAPQMPSKPMNTTFQSCLTKAINQFPDPATAFADFLSTSLPIQIDDVRAFAENQANRISDLADMARPELETLRPWLPED